MTFVDLLPTTSAEPRAVRWHRPLLWLAASMALLALVALVLRFADTRDVTGLGAWDKPLKFALSTVIYSVTWSWLIGQLDRGRRTATVAGTVIALALAVEVAVIVGAAAFGVTSHFNVSSPLAAALWSIMAVSITVLWVANLVIAVVLFRTTFLDRARTLAIRSAVMLSLLGLALGFLMTSPTSDQLADFQGVAGAHTVGLADGGPGLPILGWSTVAGDLRVPHFVGMHALQAIPIVLILIELLSRRVAVLRVPHVRSGLVGVVAAGYLGLVVVITWQALRGESIVQPGAATVGATAVLAAGMLVAAGLVLVRGRSATAVTQMSSDSPG